MQSDNKKILKCIRDGIFCLMTGTIIFARNSIIAEAEENSIEPNTVQDANNTETKQEAIDIIEIPSEPVSSESSITETETTVETTTENIYVNETESAIAITEETVKEVETKPEALTRDTENVTVTETENNIITTGEYKEDLKSTEISSTTTIVTENDELAEDIIKEANAEDGTKVDNVSETYILNAGSESSTAIDITNKADELKETMNTEDIEDATFIVEKTGDETTVKYQIEDEAVPLESSVNEAIIKSAQENIVETKTLYYINGQEVDENTSSALKLCGITQNTNFIVTPINETEVKITYVDAEGVTQTVNDSQLKETLTQAAANNIIETQTYTGTTEYETEEAAQEEINSVIAQGYTNVKTTEGTTTHTETYVDSTVYTSKEEAEAAGEELKKPENGGYETITISETPGTGEEIIEAFDKFEVTTKEQYEEVIKLPTTTYNNETVYYKDNGDGTLTYYKVDKINEVFTILAESGSIMTPWGVEQHQEGAYIIDGNRTLAGNVQTDEEYKVNFDSYAQNEKKRLSTEKTEENTLSWHTDGTYFYGEKKIEINAGGTYYIEASQFGRIYLNTSDDVTIVLYNDTDSDAVTLPLTTTKFTYEQNQTGRWYKDFGNIDPHVTFVTTASKIEVTNNNNLGNILATNTSVHLNSGNFCGTIVCKEISGFAEGHYCSNSYNNYLVDTAKVKAAADATYTISAEKEVTNLIVTGSKDILGTTVNTVEYSKGETSIDKVNVIQISRHSEEVERGTWEEITPKENPQEPPTPPIPPEPPVIPPTPPENPPENPGTPPEIPEETPEIPTIIIEDDTPLATEVAQALEAEGSNKVVLGTRKAATNDTTHNSLISVLIILGASITAIRALKSLKED